MTIEGVLGRATRTVRVAGTIDRPNPTGNDRDTRRERNANRYCGWVAGNATPVARPPSRSPRKLTHPSVLFLLCGGRRRHRAEKKDTPRRDAFAPHLERERERESARACWNLTRLHSSKMLSRSPSWCAASRGTSSCATSRASAQRNSARASTRPSTCPRRRAGDAARNSPRPSPSN